MIHIFCAYPGMIRGGRSNPRFASYHEGEHSPDELRELLADPDIDVVTGGEALTAEHVKAIEAAAKKAGKKVEG